MSVCLSPNLDNSWRCNLKQSLIVWCNGRTVGYPSDSLASCSRLRRCRRRSVALRTFFRSCLRCGTLRYRSSGKWAWCLRFGAVINIVTHIRTRWTNTWSSNLHSTESALARAPLKKFVRGILQTGPAPPQGGSLPPLHIPPVYRCRLFSSPSPVSRENRVVYSCLTKSAGGNVLPVSIWLQLSVGL